MKFVREASERVGDGSANRRKKLADIMYWDVLQQIRTGKYGEDQKLPSEKDFCQRFGVSRPIVREALERLRSDGLIYSRQGAGSFVRGATSKRSDPSGAGDSPRLVKSIADVRNIYEFRIVFEGEMAFLAATVAGDAAIESMRIALEAMTKALMANDPALEEDMEFHAEIARATNNQFYGEVLKMLRPHMVFVMELVMKLSIIDSEEHNVAVQTQHLELFERIRDHDPEGARNAMRTMLTNSRNRVFHGIDDSSA